MERCASGWLLLAPAVPYLDFPGDHVRGGRRGDSLQHGQLWNCRIFMLIVFLLAIALFVFTVHPGTKGPNKYGADPYGGELEEVFA